MKITRESVDEYAKTEGLEPVQIDTIPEGFSFKEPSLTIGDERHEGQYIAFVPMREWGDEKAIIRTVTTWALQTLFKKYNGKGNN